MFAYGKGASNVTAGFPRLMPAPLDTHRRLLIGAAILLALGASLLPPVPEDPPDIALGSIALLLVERAVAFLGLVGAAGVVLNRAARGQIPTQLGYLSYESLSREGDEARIVRLEKRVHTLEVLGGIWRPDALEGNGDDP
jgi:hypothetical protein